MSRSPVERLSPGVLIFGFALLGALLLRLGLAPFPGFFLDLDSFVQWGQLFLQHPADPYVVGALAHRRGRLIFPPNYPPLALFLDGAAVWVFQAVSGTRHVVGSDVASHGLLPTLLKVPAIALDLVAGTALYLHARRLGMTRRGLVLGIVYLFSPSVLFLGALWGQLDTAAAALGLVALVLALAQRPTLAGIAMGLAAMLKPEPVIFAPLLFLFIWRTNGGRELQRSLAAFGGTLLVLWLPLFFSRPNEAQAFVGNVIAVDRQYGLIYNTAYGFWWLFGATPADARPVDLGSFPVQPCQELLVLLLIAAAAVSLYRSPTPLRLVLGSAVVLTGLFVFGPMEHERHLTPVLPVLALLTLYELRYAAAFTAASVSTFLNMALVALPAYAHGHPGLQGWWFQPHPPLAEVIAVGNVALFVFLALEYFRPRRKSREVLAPTKAHALPRPS